MLLRQFNQRSKAFDGFPHDFPSIGREYYLPLHFESPKEASASRPSMLLAPQFLTTSLMRVGSGLTIYCTGQCGRFIYLNSTISMGNIVGLETVTGGGSGFLCSVYVSKSPTVELPVLYVQEQSQDHNLYFHIHRIYRSHGLAICHVELHRGSSHLE